MKHCFTKENYQKIKLGGNTKYIFGFLELRKKIVVDAYYFQFLIEIVLLYNKLLLIM